jgi:hypothetical protein
VRRFGQMFEFFVNFAYLARETIDHCGLRCLASGIMSRNSACSCVR